MASSHTDSIALRQSIEVPDQTPKKDIFKRSHAMTLDMPSDEMMATAQLGSDAGQPPSKDNCDGRDDSDPSISIPSKAGGQTVAPFLTRHIPNQYAPLGGHQLSMTPKDPNTKYCYRHRPDSKCRRSADEPTMDILQRVCWHFSFPAPCERRSAGSSRATAVEAVLSPPPIRRLNEQASSFGHLLTKTEPGNFVSGRSTGHLSCLGSLLRSSSKTPKSHAARHPYTMLLPTTILPFHRRSRPYQDRLHIGPPQRDRIQDTLFSGHHLAL
jgi:hypothetical protein